MVLVTDKKYYMDKALKSKLDLMIERCTGKNKMDNLVLVDGDEGFGKTTLIMGMAYYVSHTTGRPFSVDNVFFDVEKLTDFAKRTEGQIIVWDEAALSGLASEWWKKGQRNLIKLLMIARKKRHFFFFAIPKFYKLAEYLSVDRSICLIHVYARNEIELGRFVYYMKKAKERLFVEWRQKKTRGYRGYYNLRGSFTNVLSKVIDEEAYEKKKDEAIMSFDKDDDKGKRKLIYLKWKCANFPGVSDKDKASFIKIHERNVVRWRKLHEERPWLEDFVFGGGNRA
jgi:energy-coupling factor transporter ATP-binding protein EcfA2